MRSLNCHAFVFALLTLGLLVSCSQGETKEVVKIDWVRGYSSARRTGTDSLRPVLLFVTTDGCRHCVRMESRCVFQRRYRTTNQPVIRAGHAAPRTAQRTGRSPQGHDLPDDDHYSPQRSHHGLRAGLYQPGGTPLTHGPGDARSGGGRRENSHGCQQSIASPTPGPIPGLHSFRCELRAVANEMSRPLVFRW